MTDTIIEFLAGSTFAVVGASTDRNKYGNKVLRCYQQVGRTVTPVNPKEALVEGLVAVPSVAALPAGVHGLSIVTPPTMAYEIVESAHARGIRHIWFQPGAESDKAVAKANELGMNCISGGPCLLVILGYRESTRPF